MSNATAADAYPATKHDLYSSQKKGKVQGQVSNITSITAT